MSTEIKINSPSSRVAWNKGRLVGQKRPLRPKEVWAIRVRLQIKRRERDLAMFNLAIDSKLRGCDLVSLRVDDIASGGAVTRTEFGRLNIGEPDSDSGRGGGSPRPEGFLAEDAERAAGCEMALDVECVVNGGVNGQEALG